MAKSRYYVKSNYFPKVVANVRAIGKDVEEAGAVFFQDTARAQLYPGHGYDTGAMHDGIVAEGNTVTAAEEYTIYVTLGTIHMAGLGFWEQAEMETEAWLRDEAPNRFSAGNLLR